MSRMSAPTSVRLLGVFLGAVLVAACSSRESPAAATPAEQEALAQRIAKLVEKTRKNLVFVEGGTFEMGDFGVKYGEEKLPYSSKTDDDHLHTVTLDSFKIGAYKVTYAEYDIYTEATGQPRITTHPRELALRLPDVPAGVNWQQARDYCQWVGKQAGLEMDLPTEAQWEYAARNRGQLVVYPTDNGQTDPGRNVPTYEQQQEYKQKNQIVRSGFPMAVGMYPPTALGLYDMIGNGLEWALDWYAEDYYAASPEINPKGPSGGVNRVLRSYGHVSADTLAHTSMTFTRLSEPPVAEASDSGLNLNLYTAARCVAKTEASALP